MATPGGAHELLKMVVHARAGGTIAARGHHRRPCSTRRAAPAASAPAVGAAIEIRRPWPASDRMDLSVTLALSSPKEVRTAGRKPTSFPLLNDACCYCYIYRV